MSKSLTVLTVVGVTITLVFGGVAPSHSTPTPTPTPSPTPSEDPGPDIEEWRGAQLRPVLTAGYARGDCSVGGYLAVVGYPYREPCFDGGRPGYYSPPTSEYGDVSSGGGYGIAEGQGRFMGSKAAGSGSGAGGFCPPGVSCNEGARWEPNYMSENGVYVASYFTTREDEGAAAKGRYLRGWVDIEEVAFDEVGEQIDLQLGVHLQRSYETPFSRERHQHMAGHVGVVCVIDDGRATNLAAVNNFEGVGSRPNEMYELLAGDSHAAFAGGADFSMGWALGSGDQLDGTYNATIDVPMCSEGYAPTLMIALTLEIGASAWGSNIDEFRFGALFLGVANDIGFWPTLPPLDERPFWSEVPGFCAPFLVECFAVYQCPEGLGDVLPTPENIVAMLMCVFVIPDGWLAPMLDEITLRFQESGTGQLVYMIREVIVGLYESPAAQAGPDVCGVMIEAEFEGNTPIDSVESSSCDIPLEARQAMYWGLSALLGIFTLFGISTMLLGAMGLSVDSDPKEK